MSNTTVYFVKFIAKTEAVRVDKFWSWQSATNFNNLLVINRGNSVSKLPPYDSSLKCHGTVFLLAKDVSLHSIHLKRSNNSTGNNSFNWLVLASSIRQVYLHYISGQVSARRGNASAFLPSNIFLILCKLV